MDFCIILIVMLSFFAIVGNIAITPQTNDDENAKIAVNWILWVINLVLIVILAFKTYL